MFLDYNLLNGIGNLKNGDWDYIIKKFVLI